MTPPKHERLREILRRLSDLPPSSSFREAWKRLADTMNQVEDELSGIPYNPKLWRSDGRLYPPQEDMERRAPGKRGVRVFRSVAHRTFIARNGALEIRNLDGPVVYEKPGADKKGVGR